MCPRTSDLQRTATVSEALVNGSWWLLTQGAETILSPYSTTVSLTRYRSLCLNRMMNTSGGLEIIRPHSLFRLLILGSICIATILRLIGIKPFGSREQFRSMHLLPGWLGSTDWEPKKGCIPGTLKSRWTVCYVGDILRLDNIYSSTVHSHLRFGLSSPPNSI